MSSFKLSRKPESIPKDAVVSFWAGLCPCHVVGYSRDLPPKHPLRRKWGEDVVLLRKIGEDDVTAGIFFHVWSHQTIWVEVTSEGS